MRKAALAIMLAAVLTAVALAGCASSGGSTGNDMANTVFGGIDKLVIGTTSQITDININDVRLSEIRKALTHQGMVRVAPDGGFVPALADSWETADAKTWTYHLNVSAKWHDGIPVTSRDVSFTIGYLKNVSKSAFSDVASVETPDDHTVVITLKSPISNYLMSNVNDVIYPGHIFRNVPDPGQFNDPDATIGCGPYEFAGFDQDAGIITFRANDRYHGGKPAVGTIELRMFKNADTMIMALQKGEIDTIYSYGQGMPYYYMPKLLADDDIRFLMIDNSGLPAAIYFNTNRAPYSNASFRHALSLAINYAEINNLVGGGYGSTPNSGLVPPGNEYYIDTRALRYDLNSSKAILDGLGLRDAGGDGYREMPDGSSLTTTVYVSNAFSDAVRAAELVKGYMNAAGISVSLRIVDQSTFNSAIRKHDILIFPATPAGMRMYAGLGSTYIDARKLALSNVTDPSYQTMIDALLSSSNESVSAELSADIQEYYARERPAIALYWSDYIQPYDRKYEGWTPNPLWGILSYETFYNLHAA